MNRIVVLTGAGISAESGISTFRDAGGLWENHDIMQVASPEGWRADPELVLDFYNKRRRQLHNVSPNAAHLALVDLAEVFEVHIITQNIDDLHERAGSIDILHLHGELFKARSTADPSLVYEWKDDLHLGDVCEMDSQLRPHVVWFGEAVPAMARAIELVESADMFLVIGTSLEVYPAAGLLHHAPSHTELIYIDPNPGASVLQHRRSGLKIISERAGDGVPTLVQELLQAARDNKGS